LGAGGAYKFVRCPLYGYVDLTKKEMAVLDTSPMQRLSRIKQLSHSYLVYPSAVHTRLEHSIGTLFVASKVCEALGLSPEEEQIVRLAALLHDVGQGPFSHIWEEPMRWINSEKFSHEEITQKIIEFNPEIDTALGNLKQDVLKLFKENSLYSDIISSSLDADKLDYLRRDSYHTGVAYGLFDFNRIIHTITKIHETDRDYLGIKEKGVEALENYRLARYGMHLQVYEHHARIIADNMFLNAVKFALTDNSLNRQKLVVSDRDFLAYYHELDDYSVQHQILQSSDSTVRDLMNRVRNRKLFKRALAIPMNKDGIPNATKRQKITQFGREQIEAIEIEMANRLGIHPAYVILHLQNVKIKLYERFGEMMEKKEKPIYIKENDGSITPLDEESPFWLTSRQINRLYVFCPEEFIEKAKAIALELLELPPETKSFF
jgi:uncharacterized protein